MVAVTDAGSRRAASTSNRTSPFVVGDADRADLSNADTGHPDVVAGVSPVASTDRAV